MGPVCLSFFFSRFEIPVQSSLRVHFFPFDRDGSDYYRLSLSPRPSRSGLLILKGRTLASFELLNGPPTDLTFRLLIPLPNW